MKFDTNDMNSYLSLGNNAFDLEKYKDAILCYFKGMHVMPELIEDFIFGIEASRRYYFSKNINKTGVVLNPENDEILKSVSNIIDNNQDVVFDFFGVKLAFKQKFNNVTNTKNNFLNINIFEDGFNTLLEFVLNNPLLNIVIFSNSLSELAWAVLYKIIWGTNIVIYFDLSESEDKLYIDILKMIGEISVGSNLAQHFSSYQCFNEYSSNYYAILSYIFPDFMEIKYFNNQALMARNNLLLSGSPELYYFLSKLRTIPSSRNNIVNTLYEPLVGEPKRFFKNFHWEKQENFLLEVLTFGRVKFKENTPKVSIIMPSYNRAAMISKAISSVLNQTYINWELIVVDDGSQDGTKDIINSYLNDNRIQYIEGEHKGVSFARNLGLSNISGDYVFYLDSDNTWNLCYLEVMVYSFLITNATVGYAGISLENENQEVLGYRGESFNWNDCVTSNYIDLNAFAHHIDHYKQSGGFDTSLRRMVDWDVILRYTKENACFYAPFIGCNYFESNKDKNRITMTEPRAFFKVVHLKNMINDSTSEKIANSIKLKFGIKIPAPYKNRNEWGDFHYAESLKAALEKLGHIVTLDFHGDWYKRSASQDDVVIVLRGLHQFRISQGPINIMWNISHPDQISYKEYEKFDMVFVPSYSYASFLSTFLNTSVDTLLQCTDQSRFFYNKNFVKAVESIVLQKSNKVLFVGNSRNEYRKIVKDAVEAGLDIHIYGTRWQQFLPQKYIRGENIENSKLSQYYAEYGVTLNDHWESMRVFGFMSNRIFDVLASGGKLVSDSIPLISRVFGDAVSQVDENVTTNDAINQALNYNHFFNTYKVSQYITNYHTFDNRAKTITNYVFSKLGLPLMFDKPNQYPMLNKNSNQRQCLWLLCNKTSPNYMHEMYLRYISILTSERANFYFDIKIVDSLNNIELEKPIALIVGYDFFNTLEKVQEFLNRIKLNKIPYYIDAGVNLPTRVGNYLSDYPLIDEFDSKLKLLMSQALHVFFSRDDLRSSCRGLYNSASTISYALDPRLWRDYRRAPPQANLTQKYRFFYNDLYSNNTSNLDFLIAVFDGLEQRYGSIFELNILSSSVEETKTRSWLKIKYFDETRPYPHMVEYLTSLDVMDIGLFPAQNELSNSNLSYIRFLEYSSLGMISIISNSAATYNIIDNGLAIGAENSTINWIEKISFILQNKNIYSPMIQATWNYVWQSNFFDDSTIKTVDVLNNIIESPQDNLTTTVLAEPQKNNVAVCLHLYYVHMWQKIKPYLGNINRSFDLYVTCPVSKYEEVCEIIKRDYPLVVVKPVENKGMDIFPFLTMNKEYSLWKYDAVLKLHTKNDKSDDGAHFGKICLDSLLGERGMVDDIIDKFLTNRFTGLIGPELLYRSALALMYVNGPWVEKILNTLNVDTSTKDWGFFAGTMFWINGSLLKDFSDVHDKLQHLLEEDTSVISTGGDGSWAHAFERVFSAMARKKNMDIWLTYPLHIDGRHRRIRKIDDSDLKSFSKYKISSMWYIPRHANLKKWSTILLNEKVFDSQYYLSQSGGLIPEGMDPIVHYLLFGDDLRLDPNNWFSTTIYRNNSMDVVKARVSLLVHYMMNGKKEGRVVNDAEVDF